MIDQTPPRDWGIDQTNGAFCRNQIDGDDDRVMEAFGDVGEVFTQNGRTFARTRAGCDHMDTRPWFENHYHCEDCDETWIDEWSCGCDDECPSCGHDISPDHSEDLTEPLEA